MFSLASKIFGSTSSRMIKELNSIVEKISSLENEYKLLSDENLKLKTQEFKNRLKITST